MPVGKYTSAFPSDLAPLVLRIFYSIASSDFALLGLMIFCFIASSDFALLGLNIFRFIASNDFALLGLNILLPLATLRFWDIKFVETFGYTDRSEVANLRRSHYDIVSHFL